MKTHSTAQRGTSLLELLVACAVLAAGVVAVTRLHGDLRLQADLGRQRHEAVRLAQQDLEDLRAYAVLPATPGTRAFADVSDATATIDADHGLTTNARYTLTRTVADAAGPNARHASVAVAWTDRAGQARRLVLDTLIAGIDPAAAGALALDAGRSAVQHPLGRSPRIPVAARNLGDGRSVLKPAQAGTTAFVFDAHSGEVTARCSVAAALRTRDISAGDLAGCLERRGTLLAGSVRFSGTLPPSPGESADAPLALAIAVAVDGTPTEPPVCVTEARKTVRFSVAGSLRVEAVPIDATPAFAGVASWVDTGERHAAYHCVVHPVEGQAQWSGARTIVPAGWSIGTGASQRQVCRYATDLDHSGAIDLAIEHGDRYGAVASALPHQNLLVVAGSAACPAASPVTMQGSAGDVFADLSTAALQP